MRKGGAHARARSFERQGELRPRFAARDVEQRRACLRRHKAFQAAYRVVLECAGGVEVGESVGGFSGRDKVDASASWCGGDAADCGVEFFPYFCTKQCAQPWRPCMVVFEVR